MADSAPPLLSVRDLKALENATGRPFSSVLVIKKLIAKTASNGNPFLSAELGDRGGSFSCTLFNDNPLFEQFKAAGEGGVVRVEADGGEDLAGFLKRRPVVRRALAEEREDLGVR
jgi:hypothetical protein